MFRRCTVVLAASLGCLLLLNQWTAGQADAKKTVTLKLLLPNANSEVTVDGTAIKGEGAERKVPVTVTKDSVTVSATWRPNGYTKIQRTQVVPVKAAEAVVDLTKADDKNPDKIEVIFVPTPQDVVDAMCKMAKVGPDDNVYDLGCGDGRIVLTAVGKFKAKHGVGVDFDPERVKDSKESAKKQNLDKVVEFRQGDVLDIKDLSDATVVMLYMGEDINLRLRPILQKTLKPGSRIVSHRFLMGDWKPLKTETVKSSEGFECEVHLWIVGK